MSLKGLRQTKILFTVLEDGRIAMNVGGALSGYEVLWALEQLKLKMLSGHAVSPVTAIPGMLRPDGSRVREVS